MFSSEFFNAVKNFEASQSYRSHEENRRMYNELLELKQDYVSLRKKADDVISDVELHLMYQEYCGGE